MSVIFEIKFTGFKLINLLYIPVWVLNIISFFISKSIYDKIDDYPKKRFKKFLYSYKDTISFFLKIKTILLMFISIIFSISTIFYDIETARYILGIYYIVTVADLVLNGLINSLYS